MMRIDEGKMNESAPAEWQTSLPAGETPRPLRLIRCTLRIASPVKPADPSPSSRPQPAFGSSVKLDLSDSDEAEVGSFTKTGMNS